MGWLVVGHDKLDAALKTAAAAYGAGRSYPTRIMGALRDGNGSAMIAVTNTPEIVGSELRMLSTVDFRKGKIVRWIDYWDSMALMTRSTPRSALRPIGSPRNIRRAASSSRIARVRRPCNSAAHGDCCGRCRDRGRPVRRGCAGGRHGAAHSGDRATRYLAISRERC